MTSSSSEGNARRWFVTGASSGIGRAMIERALADGDAVIASVRKPQALNDLQSLFPQTLEVEPLDVRDHEAISATVKRVLRRGPVDIVVNNAGYGAVGAAEELTSGHVDDQLQTLLHGPIAITRAFLPGLREHGGGRIVQMSSIGGQNRGSRGKRVPRRQIGVWRDSPSPSPGKSPTLESVSPSSSPARSARGSAKRCSSLPRSRPIRLGR